MGFAIWYQILHKNTNWEHYTCSSYFLLYHSKARRIIRMSCVMESNEWQYTCFPLLYTLTENNIQMKYSNVAVWKWNKHLFNNSCQLHSNEKNEYHAKKLKWSFLCFVFLNLNQNMLQHLDLVSQPVEEGIF